MSVGSDSFSEFQNEPNGILGKLEMSRTGLEIVERSPNFVGSAIGDHVLGYVNMVRNSGPYTTRARRGLEILADRGPITEI